MRVAMLLGAILIWVALLASIWLLVIFIHWLNLLVAVVLGYFGLCLFLSLSVYLMFTRWRNIKYSMREAYINAANKFGSAKCATEEDLKKYKGRTGLYIGGGYTFSDKGHILTCAGTRGGKGTNLIIPNLLGLGRFSGSWVVIDPRENAAVTRRCQLDSGKLVVILNPWDLLHDHVGESTSCNPLDILADKNSILVDDAQIIAEMLVPIDKNDKDKFFTDNARSIVAGLLVHLVTIQPDKMPGSTGLYRRGVKPDGQRRCHPAAAALHPENALAMGQAVQGRWTICWRICSQMNMRSAARLCGAAPMKFCSLPPPVKKPSAISWQPYCNAPIF